MKSFLHTCSRKVPGKRSIFAVCFAFLICISLALPTWAMNLDSISINNKSDISGQVYDEADLLTSDQISSLSDKLAEIKETYQCDVVVFTLEDTNGYDPRDYTEAIYTQCGYGYGSGKDGIILSVSMAERDWQLLTYGFGTTAVSNDYGFDYISERVVSKLSDGDYYDAFNTFAKLSEAFLKEARDGEPYSSSHEAKLTFFSRALPYLLSFGISFAVALIVCCTMAASMKTAAKKHSAIDYMEPGSFHLTKKRDYYLYTTTHRVKREKQESSSGSSGGGGGHTDSNGFGGGGGKF